MAIGDSFNLNTALNTSSYAYKCWYNYNYGNNTMGISESDMGQIVNQWSGKLSEWRVQATKDENAYEISDSDYNASKNNGKASAKDATGYDGKTGGMIARGVGDAVAATAGATVGRVFLKGVSAKIGTAVLSLAGKKCAAAATKKFGEVGALETSGSFIISTTVGLATALAYRLKKPNKEQHEAAKVLEEQEMPNAQMAIEEGQDLMAEAREGVEERAEEAEELNEEANDNIKDEKSKYDDYRASYEELKAKVDSGEQLTPEEKNLYKELVKLMGESGENIEGLQDETSEAVRGLYDEMGEFQENYDEAAETIAEVEGLTDYAEGFDSAARTMCYVEAAAQGLNAASSGWGAVKAGQFATSGGPFTAWAWAFVGIGSAGALMSGFGSKEQVEWGMDIGREIDIRKDTQDFNTETSDVYDESIDLHEGMMETVEDLELDIPDDLEVPEEPGEIAILGDGSDGQSGAVATNDDKPIDPEVDKDK